MPAIPVSDVSPGCPLLGNKRTALPFHRQVFRTQPHDGSDDRFSLAGIDLQRAANLMQSFAHTHEAEAHWRVVFDLSSSQGGHSNAVGNALAEVFDVECYPI